MSEQLLGELGLLLLGLVGIASAVVMVLSYLPGRTRPDEPDRPDLAAIARLERELLDANPESETPEQEWDRVFAELYARGALWYPASPPHWTPGHPPKF